MLIFGDQTVRPSYRSVAPFSANASAIVGLGHALGLTVIAEGVETDDEAAVLSHLGYDEFQGFHFARPMPIEKYQAWILEQRAVGKA